MKTSPNILLSGGGTGGHIFPAVAIANQLKQEIPNANFLFIGAKDKMEMEKVPNAGYDIEGLWISGINRGNKLANISFPFKLITSLFNARRIIKSFKPDLAIGTGGFASGPALYMASQMKVPVFIQEQNSYPGITNKFLKNKAEHIFVAYDGMERFFNKEKIRNYGNPVRNEIFEITTTQEEAKKELNLDPNKLTILSIGGSLGSKTLNDAWLTNLNKIPDKVQLIWQTGSLHYQDIKNNAKTNTQNLLITEFIKNMGTAYKAADIIVSRAGAIAISELCLAGKPTLLVPFPFAAEDHQTKNAENLVQHKAALMVKDSEVHENFWKLIQQLLDNDKLRKELAINIKKLAKPNATQAIVKDIKKYL